MEPAVSVVVPAYNAERFLPETVESIRSQTFQDWELIIVDDGSRDTTAKIAETFAALDSRIRVVGQENRGLSAARNRGIAASNPVSRYLIFLDSDDVWDPDALSTLVRALEQDSSAVAAYALARYVDAETQPIDQGVCESKCRMRATLVGDRVVSLDASQPSTFETFIVSGCIATPGVCLVRREVLARTGLYDTSLKQCEDWDMYIRLSRHGYFRFVDRVILGYRMHGSNMTRNRAVQRSMEARVLRKAMQSPDNSSYHLDVALRSYRSGQRFFFATKLDYLRACLFERDFRRALREARYALGHAVRYVRGRP